MRFLTGWEGWMKPAGLQINGHFQPRKYSISNSHFCLFVFLVAAPFSLGNLLPILNALVIYWPLRVKNCEQGLPRLHANRI